MRVLAIAAAAYAGVFATFVFVETPGLGLGHFLYIPICLVALVSDEARGALAGVFAAGLYLLAIELTPRVPSTTALTSATAIRLVTYTLVGALIGFYASRNRAARRPPARQRAPATSSPASATRAPSTRSSRAAARRPSRSRSSSADVDDFKELNDIHGHAAGNTALRRDRRGADASTPTRQDFVARIGGDEFAIITALPPTRSSR